MVDTRDPLQQLFAQYTGSYALSSDNQRMGASGSLNPLLAPTTNVQQGRNVGVAQAASSASTAQSFLNTVFAGASLATLAAPPAKSDVGAIDQTIALAAASSGTLPSVPSVPPVASASEVAQAQAQTIGSIASTTAFSYRGKVNIPIGVASRLSNNTLQALQNGNTLSKTQKRELENVGGHSIREQVTNAQS